MSSADETTHLLNGHGANDPLKYEAVTWSRVAAADRKEGHTRGDEEKIKIYWWRWVVLAVFTSIIAVNNLRIRSRCRNVLLRRFQISGLTL